MNILEIAMFDVGACGPTSVLKPIIKRLTNRGHSIDVFSAYSFDKEKEKLTKILGAGYYYTSGEKLIKISDFIKYVPKLKSYDLVHIHGVYNINHTIIANYLFENNIPYIVSLHGNLMKNAINHSRLKKTIAIKFFIKKMLKQSATIHVMAKEENDDLMDIVGLHNYELIYNGVASLENNSKKSNENRDKLNILFLGRLDIMHKGIDLLLDAIERKGNIFKDRMHLYLVGPYETSYDEKLLTNKIKKSCFLKNIVSIEGPKYGDEKNLYYEKCDLFVHTSRYEGMPVAVLEAMDAGMPCIVTYGTNMAAIMEECNGGFVTEGTVDNIASLLEKIITIDREYLRIKGKSAQDWSSQNLDWDKIAIQYENMYLKSSIIR